MAVRTYNNYLKVHELLELQQPLSDGPEHDEMLFIVIHQVYELWFKQVLWEIDWLRQALEENRRPRALATFKRILTIFKTLVAQIDVLETMTPISFNSFRARLESASGFQSVQFRELEFVLGYRRPSLVATMPEEDGLRQRLAQRLEEPSLYDSFLAFLVANGFEVPTELLARDRSQPNPEHPKVREILIDLYRANPDLRAVCERMVDLDEALQEWRYRHVKMVQRTIGTKPGTGGSPGAEYLKSTLFASLFPDLWAIRSEL